ncbi:uncharacterized protein LOC110854179 [Folsomia candida]|uniref:Zinc finger CCHC domain-containing protein 13 n=1 Tax=Folsomia candida TaxID=158441 RepID=A0A226DYY2_FOLCA|nr:uncharacterized protein LOC110854179 [Folsomia candida]OXA50439.1 Zinc finger CCHC domain-containing protein 13 [Folsomia candida]
MSAYKTQRGPIRTAFTKAITELTTELDKEEPDGTILQQLALRLEGHHSKLLQVNDKVEEALLKAGDTTAEEFASEYASVVEYKEKFTDVTLRLKEVMEEEETSEASSSGSSKSKSKIRLPKLEFKKYGGDPREWLSFWGQFKSIHENESMSPEEKFQYLCQATTDNSRARAIVGSYPPTAENYPKVIESLKSRFGRDEILIEVNRLSHLMEFLRVEVESDVRIKMAQTGFGNASSKKEKYLTEKSDPVSTAAELYNGDSPVQKTCIFCEKKHNSQDCYQAAKMSLDSKKKKVQEKRACFICLRVGHISKSCKSKVKCPLCGRLHHATMCPENPKNKVESATSESASADTSMSNYSHHDVMLQTLEIRISNKAKNEERLVRAVIDTGSQRSYVSKKAVQVLGFKPIGEKRIMHSLFGGQQTDEQRHKLFEIALQSKDRQFHCKIMVLDQEKICGKISRVPQGPWVKELKGAGIELTDVDVDDELRDIHVLIGADVAGDLLTGNLYRTSSGPVAIETRLGWTLMGKNKSTRMGQDGNSLIATSLHVGDLDIQALWKLDVIGIKDPCETKTREELMESASTHFKENVKINSQKR